MIKIKELIPNNERKIVLLLFSIIYLLYYIIKYNYLIILFLIFE